MSKINKHYIVAPTKMHKTYRDRDAAMRALEHLASQGKEDSFGLYELAAARTREYKVEEAEIVVPEGPEIGEQLEEGEDMDEPADPNERQRLRPLRANAEAPRFDPNDFIRAPGVRG